MKGPEGGLIWTSRCAVEALSYIHSGKFKTGYQTPASAFGSGFILDMEGVEIQEIEYQYSNNKGHN